MEIVAFTATFPDGTIREYGPNIIRTIKGREVYNEIHKTGIRWSFARRRYMMREVGNSENVYAVVVRHGDTWSVVNFTSSVDGARSSGELNVITFKCDEYHVCKLNRVVKLVEV